MFSLKSLFLPPRENPKIIEFPYSNKEGVVEETIHPDQKGCVYSNGIYWTARCAKNITLEPGELVYVVRRESIIIWVKLLYRHQSR
jgi:membrane protein implicated in regulation of membrane protease activity